MEPILPNSTTVVVDCTDKKIVDGTKNRRDYTMNCQFSIENCLDSQFFQQS